MRDEILFDPSFPAKSARSDTNKTKGKTSFSGKTIASYNLMGKPYFVSSWLWNSHHKHHDPKHVYSEVSLA